MSESSEIKSTISKEQLKKIQDFQKDLNKLLNEVGFLEAQKAQVLGKFGEINKQTEDFKKELEDEYGSININLEDGTYTPIEKEEDKK
jgi:muramoyltetrapeptide carboxypeptidase LdcA involved in peptidoglycan recycling